MKIWQIIKKYGGTRNFINRLPNTISLCLDKKLPWMCIELGVIRHEKSLQINYSNRTDMLKSAVAFSEIFSGEII